MRKVKDLKVVIAAMILVGAGSNSVIAQPNKAQTKKSSPQTVSTSSTSAKADSTSSLTPDPATSTATSMSTSISKVPATDTAKKPFGIEVTLETSSTLQEPGDVDRKAGTDLLLAPSLKISDRFTISALEIITQETTGFKDTTLSNLQVSLIHKELELSSVFKLSPRVVLTLPTNEVDRKDGTYRGSGALAGRLLYDTNSLGFNSSGFYQLSYSRAAHGFDRKGDWTTPNKQSTLSNRLVAEFPVYGGFSLVADLRYILARTYAGSADETFEHSEELAYEINDNASLAVGHNLGGSLFKSNGVDSNFKVAGNQDSKIYANVTVKY